jgi:hypothetical protein
MTVESNDQDPDVASAPNANKKPRRRWRKLSRQAAAKKNGQIDLAALIEEPIAVLKDGKAIKMNPIEAAMRRQVQKALNEKSLPAIKELISLALTHGLVAWPAPPQGGLIIIPKTVSEEDQKIIFSYPGPPVAEILLFLEHHYAELEQKR